MSSTSFFDPASVTMTSEDRQPARTGSGVSLSRVRVKVLGDSLEVLQEYDRVLELDCIREGKVCNVSLRCGEEKVLELSVAGHGDYYCSGPTVVLLKLQQGSAFISTTSQNDASRLVSYLAQNCEATKKEESVFNSRTDESSAKQYFQVYGYLSQQQNMLQDYVRTGTYQSAMLQNPVDFKDKVVLDVGTGTGALSFFALQAGARKVYSIEASNMAAHCQKLVRENNYSDKMTIIRGKVEEVKVPEQVDMIVSEPMGYMLFNERMIESYLHAKKWLKPGGNMFPTKGILYAAPFSDERLYLEQISKANFWTQKSFHGINVSCLKEEALDEYFKQPVKDTFDVRIVMAKPVSHMTDFLTAAETDLVDIQIPLQYKMWSTGMVHGLAFWFDCVFSGSESSVWLSTAPSEPPTHWHQIRLLLPNPIFLRKDQEVVGHLSLLANERQSYDVTVDLDIPGTGIKTKSSYDLKNPNLRYMSTPVSVPGSLHTSPTESYFVEPSQTNSQQPTSMKNVSPSSAPTAQITGPQFATSLGARAMPSGVNFSVLTPLKPTTMTS